MFDILCCAGRFHKDWRKKVHWNDEGWVQVSQPVGLPLLFMFSCILVINADHILFLIIR